MRVSQRSKWIGLAALLALLWLVPPVFARPHRPERAAVRRPKPRQQEPSAKKAAQVREKSEEGRQSCSKAEEFELEDQFKKPHALTFPREKVTVLMFADIISARQAEKWAYALYARYGERITMEGVGAGRFVPSWQRPIIRFILRRITSYPIMLDWKGPVSRTYNYQAKKVNLFVIDPGGTIVLKVIGRATPDRLNQVFSTLDGLLAIEREYRE